MYISLIIFSRIKLKKRLSRTTVIINYTTRGERFKIKKDCLGAKSYSTRYSCYDINCEKIISIDL